MLFNLKKFNHQLPLNPLMGTYHTPLQGLGVN